MSKDPPRSRGAGRRVVLAGIVLLISAVGVRLWVLGLFRVVSISMAPTLVAGDVVVVDQLAYLGDARPRRGDVILFDAPGPGGGEQTYVKRVVGLPGDAVVSGGRRLVIGDVEMGRELVGEVRLDPDGAIDEHPSFLLDYELWEETLDVGPHAVLHNKALPERPDGRWMVEAGHVFVLGDNRDDSTDSRHVTGFGQVPLSAVVGRVRRIAYSGGASGLRWARLLAPVR